MKLHGMVVYNSKKYDALWNEQYPPCIEDVYIMGKNRYWAQGTCEQ